MKHKRFKQDPKKQIGAKSNTTLFIFITFAAILSVLILGYLRFFGDVETVIEVAPKKQLRVAERMKNEIDDKLPQVRSEMFYPSEQAISGRWYSRIGSEGITEITFNGDEFELIYVSSAQSYVRKYSKGKFTYDQETGDLGLFPVKGEKPDANIKGVRYKILTMRRFHVMVSQKIGDPALYLVARERDVPGKNYHPLFLYDDFAGAPVLRFSPVAAAAK